jgi:hypothetical protein
MVRTNTPKALWTMAKVYHCPKKLLWKKCFLNRCKITHLCLINKFWELFESSILCSSPNNTRVIIKVYKILVRKYEGNLPLGGLWDGRILLK